jgi:two-component system nitrogen regulation sensor histidine kinase NtrY
VRRASFERTILALALGGALPAVLVCGLLLWREGASAKLSITAGVFVLGAWLFAAFALRERLLRTLQALASLLEALRGGDYSIRARGAREDEALGEVHREINALSEALRDQRLGVYEATALLRAVMDRIDVVVVAFDEEDCVRLVNPAAARLLGDSEPHLLGKSARELGVGDWLTAESPSTIETHAEAGPTRWEIHRTTFRQAGVPHRLVVLTEVQRAQREEERRAWQRLVRVLGHEINNSLAPISSLAVSLRALAERQARAADWEDDLRSGLDVIARRAQGLERFMTAYAQLARLPSPRFAEVDVPSWIARVAALERRVDVVVPKGPAAVVRGDGDQLDQLLINLVRNAADAALEGAGRVAIGWSRAAAGLVVTVEDDGAGITEGADLFVPFYTTKPNGSGIGLALARQIAEAHGGRLTLANRTPSPGCEARLVLPLGEPLDLR